MNLGKLLGAGKSFFGGGGNVAYREDKKFNLPKFNADRNPFAPKPVQPAPVAAPETKKVFTPPPAAGPTRATSWKDKLNPFRAPEPARLAAPNAVQVELSLEAVKVVHNDLADADIEIVPVKSRTASPAEAPVLPPTRSAWEFLGERLVKQT
jgi:hypothetical protein